MYISLSTSNSQVKLFSSATRTSIDFFFFSLAFCGILFLNFFMDNLVRF